MDYKKPSLLYPEGDPNQSAPGFSFSRNDFEDLIDNFTDTDSIPVLLGVSPCELDTFCKHIYNMNFKETYNVLFQRANLYYRKAMFSLAKVGNPTAIKVASEFYVRLGSLDKSDSHITFIANIPVVPSDEDKLKVSLKNAQDAQASVNKHGI